MALQGFNEQYYLDQKLTLLKAADPATWGTYDTAGFKDFLATMGLSPEQHYIQYGSAEGIDPAATFDESAYLNAKLTKMQAADPEWAGATIADLRAAIAAAGMTTLGHYNTYAAAEGNDGSYIVPTEPTTGRNYKLTSSTDEFTGTRQQRYL